MGYIRAETPQQAVSNRQERQKIKTSKGQFAKLTGYMGQSNEHSRDAATLIFNKNVNWAKMKFATQNHGVIFK